MLQVMRNYTRSFIAIFLFGLLILSFATWGIGDIFRNRAPDPVIAEVGGQEILASSVRTRFNRELEQIQAQTGTTISANQAIAFGLHVRALEGLIQQALHDHEIRDRGLVVSDDRARAEIMASPVFRNQLGQFDRNVFNILLQRNGLTEAGYVAGIKSDIAQGQLYGSLIQGVTVPDGYADAFYRFRKEKRVADLALIDLASFQDIAVPGEEALQSFYEANKSRFAEPEYRRAKYVYIRPDDVMGEIEVTDEQVQNEYEARRGEYSTPELRDMDQFLTNDELKAKQVVALVGQGRSLEAAAKEVSGQDNAIIKLGEVKKSDLPSGIADGAFAIGDNKVGEPLRSPLGWHVFRVNKITPGTIRPLSEVRDELVQEIRRQAAPDRVYALLGQLERQLNQGETLETAAQAINMPVRELALADARGNGPDGNPVAGLPAAPEFLRSLFAARQGEEGLATEAANGDVFALRVEEIRAARTPPLDEIKLRAIEAWQQEERRKMGVKLAEDIVNRVNAGAELAAQARNNRLETRTSRAITREEEDRESGLTRQLVTRLFALDRVGMATFAPVGNGVVIARVKEITPADPAQDKAGLDEIVDGLRQALQDDVLFAYDQMLRQRYQVTVNQQELSRLFPLDQSELQ